MRRILETVPRERGAVSNFSIQLPYSTLKVCNGLGRMRSTQLATGSEARINHGVVKVVRAETTMATG